MSKFNLVIASPGGNIFAGEVNSISLRGAGGDLAVLAGHAPFMTQVKEGKCKIELDDGSERNAFITSGILTVAQNKVTLISDTFRFTDKN